ncbi:membrane protein insertase YidC [Fodinicurvata halophila]|uniref:Membrane protein insertase YidC n=1 Tax=Fodinicurvata halophila TaxID=1419723 RepID=A0ABV8UL21_9PROT
MEQKNLFLAILLSLVILLGFQYFIETPQQQDTQDSGTQQEQTTSETAGDRPSMDAGDGERSRELQGDRQELDQALSGSDPDADREEVLEEGPRVAVDTPKVEGSISLVGGRLDDLTLKRYHETIDEESPNIELLNPVGSARPYYADFGWAAGGEGVAVPRSDSEWGLEEGETLTADTPVTIRWDNGEGLVFRRTYAIDQDYMVTVTQEVENTGAGTVTLAPYGLISRTGTPETTDFFILHEGLIGVLNDELREISYDDLRDDDRITASTRGGWLGITDKYWMVSLIPDQEQEVESRFLYSGGNNQDKYQTDVLYGGNRLSEGQSTSTTTRLFAGAKEVTLLDRYSEQEGIPKFDLAVDFGWFYFLTKPIFLALHWIAGLVGNFGVAILVLTVFIKILFFPLANKSYRSMAKMRKLQPEMMRLKERFSDDRQRLNQEMMALYKKEGANPASGCLPILVQIPVFFALYKVLFVTIEMRHAPFFGWIQDLSAPDPTSILNLFGLLPYTIPDLGPLEILSIGIWPILMGLSMYGQQLLNPQPPDPVQAKVFMFLPLVFTFFLAGFPAGLVVYWTWNNLLSVMQQYVIMKQAGAPIGRKANQQQPAAAAADGGSAPANPEPENEEAPQDKASGGQQSSGQQKASSGQKASGNQKTSGQQKSSGQQKKTSGRSSGGGNTSSRKKK